MGRAGCGEVSRRCGKEAIALCWTRHPTSPSSRLRPAHCVSPHDDLAPRSRAALARCLPSRPRISAPRNLISCLGLGPAHVASLGTGSAEGSVNWLGLASSRRFARRLAAAGVRRRAAWPRLPSPSIACRRCGGGLFQQGISYQEPHGWVLGGSWFRGECRGPSTWREGGEAEAHVYRAHAQGRQGRSGGAEQ